MNDQKRIHSLEAQVKELKDNLNEVAEDRDLILKVKFRLEAKAEQAEKSLADAHNQEAMWCNKACALASQNARLRDALDTIAMGNSGDPRVWDVPSLQRVINEMVHVAKQQLSDQGDGVGD